MGRRGAFFGKTKTLPFQSTWNTANVSGGSSASNQITLPLVSNGVYNFTIDWGDSTQSTITAYNQPAVTHTYGAPGVYVLKIRGVCIGWQFVFTGDRNKILSIQSWGDLQVDSGGVGAAFAGCSNLTLNAVTDVLKTTGCATLSAMFNNCTSLTSINRVSEWDLTPIIALNGMFQGANNFNDDLSAWNVSNVFDASAMFSGAANYTNDGVSLNSWNVTSLQYVSNMFGFTQYNSSLSAWNTSSFNDCNNMFVGSSFNQDINNWNVQNVVNMNRMFMQSQFNQPLSNWNIQNVSDMGYMFYNCPFDQNISAWNPVNVQDMSYMFGQGQFNQYINNWNVQNVTNMQGMFQNNFSFNQPLGLWFPINVFDFTLFMDGKDTSNYSSNNLDDIYNSWSQKNVQTNLTISFGNIQYTAAGQGGRTDLENNKGWTIFDGGLV